ncbi:MAG: lipopolysaccharide biosynthesis protein RfbH [Sarcina sp.]
MLSKEKILRENVLKAVKEYYDEVYKDEEQWRVGKRINYAGRCFDEKELLNGTEAILDFWLTSGKWVEKFEKGLSEKLSVKYCSVTNSGSSANLLAFMSLTSPKLGDRRIKKGDEVITVAAGFPTTVNPIVQYGAIPVFLDVNLENYNIKTEDLEKALSNKTKAIMLAHSLGNPFDIKIIKDFCSKNNLWLIEDNCDSLGSKYYIDGKWKYTGTIGDIGTSSFYPAHHITMGEGGAVYTNNFILKKLIDSFRDWGRDCFCPSGKDNSCKKRFTGQFGEMPYGYDHKYIYSHLGYNLKITDIQGAIGVAQLEKLDDFVAARKTNWELYNNYFDKFSKYFLLPKKTKNSDPSWFGFLVTIKDERIKRRDLIEFMEEKLIQTRLLFAGNLVKQPAYTLLKDEIEYKVVGELKNTDLIMENSFWLGTYPKINESTINYISKIIEDFLIIKGIL